MTKVKQFLSKCCIFLRSDPVFLEVRDPGPTPQPTDQIDLNYAVCPIRLVHMYYIHSVYIMKIGQDFLAIQYAYFPHEE